MSDNRDLTKSIVQITSISTVTHVSDLNTTPECAKKNNTIPYSGKSCNGDCEVNCDENYFDICTKGYGFLACHCDRPKKVYVITTADQVLLPPNYAVNVSRYPFHLNKFTEISDDRACKLPVRHARILVKVKGLCWSRREPYCGTGKDECSKYVHDFTYSADLVGYAGKVNIAVLEIDCDNKDNQRNPRLHEFRERLLTLSPREESSRGLRSGVKVWAFGEKTGSSVEMKAVLVQDFRFLDDEGCNLEHVLTSGCDGCAIGSPLINCKCEVVGIVSTDEKEHCLKAISVEHFRDVFGTLIRSPVRKQEESTTKTKRINDPLSPYYRYLPGYLGIRVKPVVSKTFFTDCNGKLTYNEYGGFACASNFKNHVGYEVIGIAGEGCCKILTKCCGPYNCYDLDESPLKGKLDIGDVILSMRTNARSYIGNSKCGQVTPLLYTYPLRNGEIITIQYMKRKDYNEEEHPENKIQKIEVAAAKMPAIYDYHYPSIHKLYKDIIDPLSGKFIVTCDEESEERLTEIDYNEVAPGFPAYCDLI